MSHFNKQSPLIVNWFLVEPGRGCPGFFRILPPINQELMLLPILLIVIGVVAAFAFGYIVGAAANDSQFEQIMNQERKFGSSLHYYLITARSPEGKRKKYLFTAKELSESRMRAAKNIEDLESPKFADDAVS